MQRRTMWGAGLTLTGTIAAVAVAAGSLTAGAPHEAAPRTTSAISVADVRTRLTALESDADRAGRVAAIADEAVLQHDTAANRRSAAAAETALKTLATEQTPELTSLLARLTALGVHPASSDGAVVTTAALVGKTRALRAVSYARKQIGDPYGFAAAGPKRYDCSGLTMRAYKAVKVSIGGHSATAQWRKAQKRHKLIAWKNRKAGDLIFYGRPGAVYHVAIYVGHGRMIEAPYPGKRVREVKVRNGDRLAQVGRPA